MVSQNSFGRPAPSEELAGMDVPSASSRVAATVEHLNPTPAQLRELTGDVADSIMGSAVEINHTIGGRKVVIEHEDDRLDVLIDDRTAASFATSRVELTGYPLTHAAPAELAATARTELAAATRATLAATTVFKPTSPEALQEARDIVDAVTGGRRPTPVEPMPGFDNFVAGAAIALDRHAADDLGGTDWLNKGATGRAHLTNAVARMVDTLHTPGPRPTVAEAMGRIATDALLQADATATDRVSTDAGRATAFGQDVRLVAMGRYHELPAERQMQIGHAMDSGSNLDAGLKAGISDIARLVEVEQREVGPASRLASERIADFRDYGTPPLFNPVFTAQYARVAELHRGAAPTTPAEAAVALHIEVTRSNGRDAAVDDRARAQAIADLGGDARTIGAIARRIEAHAIRVQEAVDHPPRWSVDTKEQYDIANRLATSHPGHMPVDAQIELYSAVVRGERVGAIASMRMTIEGARMEAELEARASTREQAVARPGVLAGIAQAAVSRGG